MLPLVTTQSPCLRMSQSVAIEIICANPKKAEAPNILGFEPHRRLQRT